MAVAKEEQIIDDPLSPTPILNIKTERDGDDWTCAPEKEPSPVHMSFFGNISCADLIPDSPHHEKLMCVDESPLSPPLWEQGSVQDIPPPPPLIKRPDLQVEEFNTPTTIHLPARGARTRTESIRSIRDDSGDVIGYYTKTNGTIALENHVKKKSEKPKVRLQQTREETEDSDVEEDGQYQVLLPKRESMGKMIIYRKRSSSSNTSITLGSRPSNRPNIVRRSTLITPKITVPILPLPNTNIPVTPTLIKPVTPSLIKTTPVTPSLIKTTPVTPSLIKTTPVTPSIIKTTPVIPSIIKTPPVIPNLIKTTPVTPSSIKTTPVIPSIIKTTPVIPNLIKTTPVTLSQPNNNTSSINKTQCKLILKPKTKPRPVKTQLYVSTNAAVSYPQLVDMLKQVVPEPWMVAMDVRNTCVQVFKMCVEVSGPWVQVAFTLPTDGQVSLCAMGVPVPYEHPIWTDFRIDPATSTGFLKVTTVIEMVLLLVKTKVCISYAPNKGCLTLITKGLKCEQCEHNDSRRSKQKKTNVKEEKTGTKGLCGENITGSRRKIKIEPESPRKRLTLLPKSLKKCAEPTSKDVSREASPSPSLDDAADDKWRRRCADLALRLDNMRNHLFDRMDSLNSAKETSDKVPETQDEVLATLGLVRRVTEEATVRKSKRERKVVTTKRNKEVEELSFLTSNWKYVKALFSCNLHFGQYTQMDASKLRPGLAKTTRVIDRWHRIIDDNQPFLIDVALQNFDHGDPDSLSAEELRSALSTSVKQIRTLRTTLNTLCPIFSKLMQVHKLTDDI